MGGCLKVSKLAGFFAFLGIFSGLFLFFFPTHIHAAWYNSGWSYRRQITINNTQVAADLTAFPLLVKLSGLTHINSDGTDIRFTAADGTTELPREIESFSGGNLVAWVKTNLADSSDTTIYMYYGNAAAVEPAADSAYGSQNVWTANYVAVWHLKETGANPAVADSTGNANNSTSQTWTPTTGQFGGGGSFNGSSDSINFASNAGLNPAAITITAWANADVNNKWQYVSTKNNQWNFGRDIDGKYYLAAWNTSGTVVTDAHAATSATTGAWENIVFTYDGSNAKYYVNDSLVIEDPVTGNLQTTANTAHIGSQGGNGNYWDGLIDEVRIANVARSTGWITTEYNSQNNPTAFATTGTEESVDVAAPVISTLSPADGSTTADIDTTLTITFNEPVVIGTGNIIIKNAADNSTVETVAVTSGQVTGSGTDTLTINPTADFNGNTGYYVQVDATAVDDAGGNSFAGIADSATWNFTTNTVFTSGWTYRKKITVSNDNVGADLTGFPLYLGINADADIGANTQNDGDDIRFTGSDGETLLPFAKNSWTGGGGSAATASYWVKTNLNHASDTEIYIYYGNASAVDGQQSTAVWDTNFKGVWHLDDSAADTTVDDATVNSNNGTARQNTSALTTTGAIGNALTFNGSSDYVAVADNPSWDFGTGAFSISIWFRKIGEGRGDILNKKSSDSFNDLGIILQDTETMDVFLNADNVGGMVVTGSSPFSINQWHLATFTRDGSNNLTTYIDGVSNGTGTSGGNLDTNTYPIWFGTNHDNFMNLTEQFNGYLDEIRVSNTNRSAYWTKFEYCNALTTASGTCTGTNEVSFSASELAVTPTPTSTPVPTATSTPSPTPTAIPTSTPAPSLSPVSSPSSSGNPGAPSCNDIAPAGTPDLFQIDAGQTNVTLHFTAVAGATGYQISYGLDENAAHYGDSFSYTGPLWTLDWVINQLAPRTVYFFKIKAVNGCNGGDFSPTLRVATKSSESPVPVLDEKITQVIEKMADTAVEIPVVEKLVDKKIEVTKTELKSKPDFISYIVRQGDTLWSIARNLFGQGKKFADLVAWNLAQHPSLENSPDINAGWELKVDPKGINSPDYPQATGYVLDVKVLADNGAPLRGVTVTLHSNPQQSVTNQEGIAHFTGVAGGKHQVYLAYRNYSGGGQAINVTGDNTNIELVMQIQLTNGFSSPAVIAVIGFLTLLILVLLFFIAKRHK